jgi:ElaB/YqjD/DUF883 family membrane-anchored ribosome-binding protein
VFIEAAAFKEAAAKTLRELPPRAARWFIAVEGCFSVDPENTKENAMARRKKAPRNGIETIQDELATIGADVTSLGSTLGDVASAEARDMIQSIRQRLDRMANDAGSATRAGVGMVQGTIEEKPFISIAVALGVGVVLASMLRR